MTPDLPQRFLPPAGWRTHHFENPQTGHALFYGMVCHQNPSAVVVCLGGLSEFSEKYYELAHDMVARGYNFWFMDWQYQGRSGRLKEHPQRRHSDGFDADISDLHKFISDYVKPSSVDPAKGRLPLIMMAHSMGGHIGLRYLAQYPTSFDAAAFSAPFMGIYNFGIGLKFISCVIRPLMALISKSYVFGGKDWHQNFRKSDGTDIFSHDPVRDSIHNIWSGNDDRLKVGNVTFKWVIDALNSCKILRNPKTLSKINIPVLIAIAGYDKIVDNHATRCAIKSIPRAFSLEIDGANHEILMEKDEFRSQFLNAFDKMVKQNKIALE
jgi:lysophospholipase